MFSRWLTRVLRATGVAQGRMVKGRSQNRFQRGMDLDELPPTAANGPCDLYGEIVAEAAQGGEFGERLVKPVEVSAAYAAPSA